MGTTRSFYCVQNNGFTAEDLQEKMKVLLPMTKDNGMHFLQDFIPADLLKRVIEITQAAAADYISAGGTRQEKRTVIGFQPSLKWLPFFNEFLCEGFTASSRDAKRLSKVFGSPVLAFAIFDSDILFVSYCDASKNITYDYAKPNSEGMDEYDTDLYADEFPEFLLELCPSDSHNNLREIWTFPEEVFADDRMVKICELLSFVLIYSSNDLPDGYQPIYCE
jgi:hypothetical protein